MPAFFISVPCVRNITHEVLVHVCTKRVFVATLTPDVDHVDERYVVLAEQRSRRSVLLVTGHHLQTQEIRPEAGLERRRRNVITVVVAPS
ncbi:hypothetical protein WJ82_26370 [Burkholderia ubonensis]|nr:hypothetical protein WJ82_26370 [Burkholderia ubonensis]